MNLFRRIGIVLAIGLTASCAFAQTTPASTSAITPAVPSINLTVAAVPMPATVTVTPASASVAPGNTLTLNIAVTGNNTAESVPTGSIALYAGPQGADASAMTLVTTYPLTNGAVTCSYVIPNEPGNYVVEPVYSGDAAYLAGVL